MKKLITLVLVASLFFVSCGSNISQTVKNDSFQISALNGWKILEKPEEYDRTKIYIYPEGGPSEVGVKVISSSDLKVEWGRIAEITTDYAEKVSQEMEDYTVVSDKYEFVPQAQREERYEIIINKVENGQAYTIIQHLYATDGRVFYVTGTYPENDEMLGEDVREMMGSFLLAPKRGWED
ncbi:MAG TPA: hypothetical protein PKV16_06735 [Caldisericia bacterium]|nr:hypothetical protein [Caldisericia bacterium]HPF48792.1 hypothetical protein [Caldisericia bacterium]HPI84284.1 hypothetical protein [Caldisericia bacterium]HPQ93462.1 hypothetical protein [Caldisericia bacterium]HRV74920.1 hypothetical protein [Caldisericia bacterium]